MMETCDGLLMLSLNHPIIGCQPPANYSRLCRRRFAYCRNTLVVDDSTKGDIENITVLYIPYYKVTVKLKAQEQQRYVQKTYSQSFSARKLKDRIG